MFRSASTRSCRSRLKRRSFVSTNSLQSKLKVTINLILGAMNNIFPTEGMYYTGVTPVNTRFRRKTANRSSECLTSQVFYISILFCLLMCTVVPALGDPRRERPPAVYGHVINVPTHFNVPIRPSDERPLAMYGHFCLVPRVSVHDRYYCIYETIFCLYFIHIDIGYECIVLSCTVEINLLLLSLLLLLLLKAASNPDLQGHLQSVAFGGLVAMEMGQSTSESEVDGGPLDIAPSPEPPEDMGEGVGPGIGAGMSSEHTYSTVSKVPTSESTTVPLCYRL